MTMDPLRERELLTHAEEEGPYSEHIMELLDDRDDLAREVERLRELHTRGIADAVRMADELADAREKVGDARHGMLTTRAERDAAFLVANQAGERERLALSEAGRLRGELDDCQRRAAMACENPAPDCGCAGCRLAEDTDGTGISDADAPEREQPPKGLDAFFGKLPSDESDSEFLDALDARAARQCEAQHAAAGGASPSEAMAGAQRCEACGGRVCEACMGSGKVLR